MRVQARAKLNLTLRILGRGDDGYHHIETVLLGLALADDIELEFGEGGIRLEVAGPTAAGPDGDVPADESNLCWRAAEALYAATGLDPAVSIRLTKRIPVAAGLGGGSADAAAVLHELNRGLGSPLSTGDLVGIAGTLGSDVPFFAAGIDAALAWGRGHRLLPIMPPPRRPALIVVPDFGISASDAYRWWSDDAQAGASATASEAAVLPLASQPIGWEELARLAVNDLEPPVLRRHPELGRTVSGLHDAGAFLATLCGSGACVAGLFRSVADRDEAARRFDATALEGWKTVSTETLGPAG